MCHQIITSDTKLSEEFREWMKTQGWEEYLAEIYLQCEDFLDEQFLTEFNDQTKLITRWFELSVAKRIFDFCSENIDIAYFYKREQKDSMVEEFKNDRNSMFPDFLIKIKEQHFFIEATHINRAGAMRDSYLHMFNDGWNDCKIFKHIDTLQKIYGENIYAVMARGPEFVCHIKGTLCFYSVSDWLNAHVYLRSQKAAEIEDVDKKIEQLKVISQRVISNYLGGLPDQLLTTWAWLNAQRSQKAVEIEDIDKKIKQLDTLLDGDLKERVSRRVISGSFWSPALLKKWVGLTISAKLKPSSEKKQKKLKGLTSYLSDKCTGYILVVGAEIPGFFPSMRMEHLIRQWLEEHFEDDRFNWISGVLVGGNWGRWFPQYCDERGRREGHLSEFTMLHNPNATFKIPEKFESYIAQSGASNHLV